MKEGGIIRAKSNKIGHCETDGRAIHIVRLNKQHQNAAIGQPGKVFTYRQLDSYG